MTMYYEAGIPASLIPCTFVGWAPTPATEFTGLHNAVIRLKRTHGTHHSGEVLHVPPQAVVVKAGRRDYHQLVRSATLPTRTDANTLNSRS
jgi:hypothetical protein